jgi:hypothetical protein
MGSEDTEVDEQFGYRFGYHRTATVGVNGVRRTTIAINSLVEEFATVASSAAATSHPVT